jgi:AcrR family transcriptional regulator
MPSNRGFDSRDAKSRLRLIEAAHDLLAEEGYQSFSARRIAERAELKPQLVHYYFRSMEEMVVAVFQRATANYFRLHDEALSSRYPLRAVWRLDRNNPEAKRMTEFIALSKRFGALRALMRESGENFRRRQTQSIERIFAGRDVDPRYNIKPHGLAMLMSAAARNFVLEDEVNISLGHSELEAFIATLLDHFEPLEASVPQDDLVQRPS